MITQEYLKDALHYDPETGLFTWISRKQGRSTGKEPGSIVKRGSACYREITIDRVIYFAHRLAFLYMTGSHPKRTVDHIDGNGLNNAWVNLRDVTQRENNKNKKIHRDNTSGVMGVHFHRQSGKWMARIGTKYLGIFSDIKDAISARKVAEIEHGFHPNHGRIRNV